MLIRSIALSVALVALAVPTASAGGRSGNQNQVLEELYQTRTGDYSYTVDHNGRKRPRYRYDDRSFHNEYGHDRSKYEDHGFHRSKRYQHRRY